MEEREQKSGAVGCFILGVIAFMLLPLYVLGIGPACWLESHISLPVSLLKTVYAPLVFFAENWEAFGEALDWYAELWL